MKYSYLEQHLETYILHKFDVRCFDRIVSKRSVPPSIWIIMVTRTAIYWMLLYFRPDCTVSVQATAIVTGMMTITWRHEFLFCSFADLRVYLPQLRIMITCLDLTKQVTCTRLDYVSETLVSVIISAKDWWLYIGDKRPRTAVNAGLYSR
jgi:hypothetical protein